MEYVRGVHGPFTREPDRTLYLDVDPETALARSDRADKFETTEHLRQVRQNYEKLVSAEGHRFYRVDATQSPEAVIAEVEDALARWLDE
jgi:dTMP kinase